VQNVYNKKITMSVVKPGVGLVLSHSDGSVMIDARPNDAILHAVIPTQRLLLGAGSNVNSTVALTLSNVAIGRSNYAVDLWVGGKLSTNTIAHSGSNGSTLNIGSDINTNSLFLGCGINVPKTIRLGGASGGLQTEGSLLDFNQIGIAESGSNAGIRIVEAGQVKGYIRTSLDRNSWQLRVPSATSDYGLNIDLGASNVVVLQQGQFTLSNGHLGINRTSPVYNLDIQGSARVSSNVFLQGPVDVTGNSFSLPAGNILARPANPRGGSIRYNTELQTFEGFGAGDTWGSLGGVIDLDRNTFVSAELSPGANDDNVRVVTAGSERMRVTPVGDIGVGTDSPVSRLDVRGTVRVSDKATFANGALTTGIEISKGGVTASSYSQSNLAISIPSPSGRLVFTAGSTEIVEIKTTGLTPSVDNTIPCGLPDKRWTTVYTTNGVSQTSDARFKTDVNECKLGLDFISALRPVQYQWSDKNNNDNRLHYGLLAQEVEQTTKDFGVAKFGGHEILYGVHSLSYMEFVAPLVRAVQELTKRVHELESNFGVKEQQGNE
jgi:hypothetical protein